MMFPAISLVLLAALVVKVVDFLKQLTNRQWNAAFTQLCSWGGAWAVLLIAAQTQFASTLVVSGITLSKAGTWDLLLIGLAMGSTASLGWQGLANVGGGNNEVTAPVSPRLKTASGPRTHVPHTPEEVPQTITFRGATYTKS